MIPPHLNRMYCMPQFFTTGTDEEILSPPPSEDFEHLTQEEQNQYTHLEEETDENYEEFQKVRKEIRVSAAIHLPFSAEEAFEAFSNLERQATYSSWIKSVTYIEDEERQGDETSPVIEKRFSKCGMELKETKWVMGWRKFKFSWKSRVTTMERPHRIDWESTSGLQNMGSVRFEDIIRSSDEEDERDANGRVLKTRMTLSMKFIAPRIVASVLRRSDKISSLMEDKMLQPTLEKFSQVVSNDLQIADKIES